MLTGQPAGPALGDPEAITQTPDGSASPLRAQKFPRATSLSMSMSNACSPTIRFNRAFSFLQRLQPHHILRPHRLELGSPTLIGLHRHLQVPANRVDVSPLREQPVGLSRSFLTICSAVCLLLFRKESHLSAIRAIVTLTTADHFQGITSPEAHLAFSEKVTELTRLPTGKFG